MALSLCWSKQRCHMDIPHTYVLYQWNSASLSDALSPNLLMQAFNLQCVERTQFSISTKNKSNSSIACGKYETLFKTGRGGCFWDEQHI